MLSEADFRLLGAHAWCVDGDLDVVPSDHRTRGDL